MDQPLRGLRAAIKMMNIHVVNMINKNGIESEPRIGINSSYQRRNHVGGNGGGAIGGEANFVILSEPRKLSFK